MIKKVEIGMRKMKWLLLLAIFVSFLLCLLCYWERGKNYAFRKHWLFFFSIFVIILPLKLNYELCAIFYIWHWIMFCLVFRRCYSEARNISWFRNSKQYSTRGITFWIKLSFYNCRPFQSFIWSIYFQMNIIFECIMLPINKIIMLGRANFVKFLYV